MMGEMGLELRNRPEPGKGGGFRVPNPQSLFLAIDD